MSKIKATEDALAYERQVVESKQKSYRRLSQQADAYERKITNLQIQEAVAFRDKSLAYERKITDQQFSNVEHLNDEHRLFHDREHVLYEDAIEKASVSIRITIDSIIEDMRRYREEASKWMTVERYEREHQQLEAKTDLAIDTLRLQVGAEERITVKQETRDELQAQIAVTRRWLIGLAVSTGVSLLVLILKFANIV